MFLKSTVLYERCMFCYKYEHVHTHWYDTVGAVYEICTVFGVQIGVLYLYDCTTVSFLSFEPGLVV